MQASTSLTVRSLVMIASVVAIPAVAVRGVWPSSDPQPTKRSVKAAPKNRSRTGLAFQALQTSAVQAGQTTADLLAKPASAAGITAARLPAAPPADFHPPRTDNSELASRPAMPVPVFWSDGAAALPEPLGEHRQASFIARDDHRLQPTQRRTRDPGNRGPAVRSNPPPSPATVEPPADKPADHPAALTAEDFSPMEERLRELGATHYRLETWGAQGELFRFRAMMALGSRSAHNRYFEATDANPQRAVERVVAQVEKWRASQPPRKD